MFDNVKVDLSYCSIIVGCSRRKLPR